jgi:hypothetical protein
MVPQIMMFSAADYIGSAGASGKCESLQQTQHYWSENLRINTTTICFISMCSHYFLLYAHISIHIWLYIYIYAYVCSYSCKHIFIHIHIHMHVQGHTRIYIYHILAYTFMHIILISHLPRLDQWIAACANGFQHCFALTGSTPKGQCPMQNSKWQGRCTRLLSYNYGKSSCLLGLYMDVKLSNFQRRSTFHGLMPCLRSAVTPWKSSAQRSQHSLGPCLHGPWNSSTA